MRYHPDSAGFRAPRKRPLGRERRRTLFAQLAAIVALALSTIIAATVLTVGIARAGVADGLVDNDGGLFGLALLLGLVFLGMGGFILLPGNRPK